MTTNNKKTALKEAGQRLASDAGCSPDEAQSALARFLLAANDVRTPWMLATSFRRSACTGRLPSRAATPQVAASSLVINLVGGLIIGVVQHSLPLATAANNYVLLAIGDALVAQVPSLVISVAAGLLVSRVGDGNCATSASPMASST